VLAALTACSNNPEALYCQPGECAREADSGTAPLDEPPWLPAQPDDGVIDDCTACAMERCAMARDYSLDDDACTALLTCKSKCWHPACLAECEADYGFSAWYDDLWVCTFGSCGAECAAGQNWACVDRFDWRPPESRPAAPRSETAHGSRSVGRVAWQDDRT
jgi:hypothetical protein